MCIFFSQLDWVSKFECTLELGCSTTVSKHLKKKISVLLKLCALDVLAHLVQENSVLIMIKKTEVSIYFKMMWDPPSWLNLELFLCSLVTPSKLVFSTFWFYSYIEKFISYPDLLDTFWALLSFSWIHLFVL